MLVKPINQNMAQQPSNTVTFQNSDTLNSKSVASTPEATTNKTVNPQVQTDQQVTSKQDVSSIDNSSQTNSESTLITEGKVNPSTNEKFNVVASQTTDPTPNQTGPSVASQTSAKDASTTPSVVHQTQSADKISSGNQNAHSQTNQLATQQLATKQGWQEEGGKTYYYGANGQKVTGWQNNLGGNGQTQYFGPDGAQYKNGYYNINGQTYYFDKEGNVVKGWQDNLPRASAPHYFDPQSGTQAKNGYWDIDGKECYFDKDGNYVPNATDPYQNGAQTGVYRVPVTTHKLNNVAGDAIRGMDISSYEALKQAGVKFYNQQGQEEPLMKILHDNGINYIRLRVWNDPSQQVSWGWGGGNAGEANELAIAKEAAQYGIKVMVDFHYSDWWSDPGTQAIPKAWQGESHQQLCDSMTKWTEKVLTDFKNAGADVGMVQVGNEITNGFMDVFKSRDKGGTYKDVWDNAQDAQKLCDYLNAGAKGVRAIDPNALVAIHLETPKADKYNDIMNVLQAHNVDYDVLGSSFYPYWQGLDKQSDFNDLKQCEQIAKQHGKYFAVLETAWPFTLEDSDGCKNNIGPSDTDISKLYPISPQGQADELENVYNTVMGNDNGLGAFYWEPAWIAVKAGTDNWNNYNSPANKKYGTESGWDNQAFFGDHGRALQSLNTYNQMVGENNQTYAKVEYVNDDTGKMSFGGFQRVTTGDNLSFSAPNGMKITKIDTEKPQNYDIWIQTPAQNKFHINNDNSWSLKSSLPGSETFIVHYTNNKNATVDSNQTDTGSTVKPNTDNKPATNNKPNSSISGSSTNSSKPATNSGSSANKPNAGSQSSSGTSKSGSNKPASSAEHGTHSTSSNTTPQNNGHNAQPANNSNDVNHNVNGENPSKPTGSTGTSSTKPANSNSGSSQKPSTTTSKPANNSSTGNADEEQPVQKSDGSKASNPDALVPDSNEPGRPATTTVNGKPTDGNSNANVQGQTTTGSANKQQQPSSSVKSQEVAPAAGNRSANNSMIPTDDNRKQVSNNDCFTQAKTNSENLKQSGMSNTRLNTNNENEVVQQGETEANNSRIANATPVNNKAKAISDSVALPSPAYAGGSKSSNSNQAGELPETGMDNDGIVLAATTLALAGVAMLNRKEKE